jgi:DNA-directed RNA polymerase alpha subunit
MLLSYGLLPASKVDLKSDIEALNFSTRVYNALKRNKINTVGELIDFGAYQVSKIDSIGVTSIEHIKRVLSVHCLSWQTQFIRNKPEGLVRQVGGLTYRSLMAGIPSLTKGKK